MRVYQTLCYLCYQDGEEIGATHQYTTPDGQRVDICKKHIEACKEAKLKVTKLGYEEMIKEY